MARRNVGSGTRWETIAGYSRAVRSGPFVFVARTTAWDEHGEIVGEGDAYAQTVQVLRNIARGLEAAGAALKDVVRTRAFVTDINRWEDVARAHNEVFQDIRPALTMVQVNRLMNSRMLVEIEADAMVEEAA